jgi:hypothetical protein
MIPLRASISFLIMQFMCSILFIQFKLVEFKSLNRMGDTEIYKKVKLLGEGSFGKAYLVECQSDNVSPKA